MFCDKCGAEINEKAKFCKKCGADLNDGSSPAEMVQKKKKRRPLMLALIVLIVLALAGGLLYMIVSGNREKKMQEQLALAEHYLDELDYDKAIAAYKAAIEIDPENEEVIEALARAYTEWAESEKDPEAAGEIYREAREYFEELEERRSIRAAGEAAARMEVKEAEMRARIQTADRDEKSPTEELSEKDKDSEMLAKAASAFINLVNNGHPDSQNVLEHAYFNLAYIDDDDIPELVWSNGFFEIYKYTSDGVKLIFSGRNLSRAYYTAYYEKSGYIEEEAQQDLEDPSDYRLYLLPASKGDAPGYMRRGEKDGEGTYFEVDCSEWDKRDTSVITEEAYLQATADIRSKPYVRFDYVRKEDILQRLEIMIQSPVEAIGRETPEELVKAVFHCVNNGCHIEEIQDCFSDWRGLTAYLLMKYVYHTDMNACADVVYDMEKGTQYIYDHYPEFVSAWKEERGENYSEESFRRWMVEEQLLERPDAELKSPWTDQVLKAVFAEYAPYSEDYDPEKLWHDDSHDYYSYSVRVSGEQVTSVDIEMFKRDGRYYIFRVHKTWSD